MSTLTPLASRRSPGRGRPLVRRRAGFSLAELMVAMVILSVGLLALAGASVNVARQSRQSQRTLRATALADARFETFRGDTLCRRVMVANVDTSAAYPDSTREYWTAKPLPTLPTNFNTTDRLAIVVTDSVSFLDAYMRRGTNGKIQRTVYRFRSIIPCN